MELAAEPEVSITGLERQGDGGFIDAAGKAQLELFLEEGKSLSWVFLADGIDHRTVDGEGIIGARTLVERWRRRWSGDERLI